MRRKRLPTWAIVVGLFLLASMVPTGATAAKPGKRRLTRAELEALARDVGFPDPVFAATIALRESGGDPNAINDTRGRTDFPRGTTQEHSVGLWQINLLAHPKFQAGDLLDARRNAEAAFEISRRGTNWGPWSTAKVKHSRGSHGGDPNNPKPPTAEELDPTPVDGDDSIAGVHVMPGWVCRECRTYNGVQRGACKHCGHVRRREAVN